MLFIDLEANSNGSHRNMNCSDGVDISSLPEEWVRPAYIPDDMELPETFPFLESIEAEEVTYYRVVEEDGENIETEPYTMLTVTSMVAGVMPEPEPEPEAEPTTEEILNAMLGVE